MAPSSTTVDLSRLPPPTVIELLGFDEIVAAMFAKAKELLPSFDAAVDSDPAVKVLQVGAYHEQLIRQACSDAARQVMTAYATGANLDQLGANVGVARLIVTSADQETGADAIYESDDAYRQRIVLAAESFSVAGPELAYVFHAKSASGTVLDASATSPAPGEVLVSVLSGDGDGTADQALLDAVEAVVTDPKTRPLGDAVAVAPAEIVNFAIAATLFTFSGPDSGLVLETARAKLDAYLAASRKLGRDVTTSGIIAALMVVGVQRVVLASPAVDVVCSATQAAWCTDIELTHGGYDD